MISLYDGRSVRFLLYFFATENSLGGLLGKLSACRAGEMELASDCKEAEQDDPPHTPGLSHLVETETPVMAAG